LNSPVRSIGIGEDVVRVSVDSHGDEGGSFEARAVVIASGCDSKLVNGLGLGRVGDFVMGAQAEVETIGVDEVEVYLGQEIAPSFFAWLVPTSPNRALVGLLSRRSPGLYLKKFMLSLLAWGKIASAEAGMSYRRIALKSLTRTYGQRLMVVGSAAGQIKPINGGGIYYGLLCADLAADSLHQALQNDALSARNLANYEREWKRKLGWELKVGHWTRRLYEVLGDKQIDRIFDIIGSDGIGEALLKADDLSFDWHGGVVLRLIGHRALSRVTEVVKIPFPSRGRD
jgi:flavin-dependent dehydrogenase